LEFPCDFGAGRHNPVRLSPRQFNSISLKELVHGEEERIEEKSSCEKGHQKESRAKESGTQKSSEKEKIIYKMFVSCGVK
jgi:hypothetical protein